MFNCDSSSTFPRENRAMIQYYYKEYGANRVKLMSESLDDAMERSPSHLILCIHAKNQLGRTNTITNALPNNLVKALQKNNRGIYRQRNMYLLTEKITPPVQGGVAIAPFINLDFLPRIEHCTPDTIIYIPWGEDDLSAYQVQTNAKEI